MITIWSIKELFTKGIIPEVDCEVSGVRSNSDVTYATRDMSGVNGRYLFLRMGTDAFLTEGEAKEVARVKCKNKLRSLETQKLKIEKLLKSLG